MRKKETREKEEDKIVVSERFSTNIFLKQCISLLLQIEKSGFMAYFITDLDECRNNNAGCQQRCTNTIGSFFSFSISFIKFYSVLDAFCNFLYSN